MLNRDKTLAEEIQARFQDLTRAEKQLANTLLENYPILGLDSITSVAESANVSTPTVVRMAQKLGYSGFPELQTKLRSELKEKIANPIIKHDKWAQAVPDTHILNSFADATINNLRHSIQQLNPSDFDAVVDLISDSNRKIGIVGGRISRSLADYLFTHLQIARADVMLVAANSNTWPQFLLNMNKDDVLIIFDVRRYEYETLKFAEMASAQGLKLVLITDQWESPVAKFSDYSFRARIEAPSAWDSSMVLLFIVETIITASQNKTWESTKDRIEKLEKLFDQTGMFSKSS